MQVSLKQKFGAFSYYLESSHLALNGLNDSKSIGTSLPISSRLSQLTPATTAHFLTAEDEKEQELEQEEGGGGLLDTVG